MKKRIFGELELSILNIVKKEKIAMSVRDVLVSLDGIDKYTTIMTVMNRLVSKGDLKRKKEGKTFYYSMSEKKRIRFFDKIKERIFGGKPTLMISYLLENEEFSDAEIKELEELLKKRKS